MSGGKAGMFIVVCDWKNIGLMHSRNALTCIFVRFMHWADSFVQIAGLFVLFVQLLYT